LQTPRAVLIRPAGGAGQIQPKPVRNGILGLGAGFMLGIGLAFLWDALSSRVRSADRVADRLRLPLLARVPRPPRSLRKTKQLVIAGDPSGPDAEVFRILRTNVELVNVAHRARTIMVTSAVEKEGKSTTVANLALAFALAGRRVVLLDLDLRSPSLHSFFAVDRQPGLTDMVLRGVSASEAIVRVNTNYLPFSATANGNPVPSNVETVGDRTSPVSLLASPDQNLSADRDEMPYALQGGSLALLPAGTPTPNAGEFVARVPLARILADIEGEGDLILIDGPPLVGVGDALAISSAVDGILVVTRLDLARDVMLADLDRILEACPAAKLGLIATGSGAKTGYDYLTYANIGDRTRV
jgi:succinoglycan biosynthesis transport protein ExoP